MFLIVGLRHEVPVANAQHPLVGPYHQCRGTPENRLVNNQRNPTQPSLVSLFGHVARLDPEVPANKALLLMVNSHEGRKPSTSWTRPPGRPRRTWLNLVQEDANAIPLSSLWRTEIFRGHGAAQWSVRTTRR